MTWLLIESAMARNLMMESLFRWLNEDEKNMLIVVAQDVVPILTQLLDSAFPEMRVNVVSAISRVCIVDNYKHVLIAKGLQLINQVIRILKLGSGFAKEEAFIAKNWYRLFFFRILLCF